MNNTWKTILRAAGPVVALVVLALGMRLLPSASGSAEPFSSDSDSPNRGEHLHLKRPTPQAVKQGPVDMKTQHALQKVVSGQLAAISHENFEAALGYAQPELRRTWSPDTFREMLQRGYAPMLSYRRASYAPARLTGDVAMMTVTITTADGQDVSYLYTLSRGTESADGDRDKKGQERAADSWYVNGVAPLAGGEDGDPAPPVQLQEA